MSNETSPRPDGRGKGFTLLEIVLGVVIFAVALVPILRSMGLQSRQAYSVGKHILGSQIAGSLLDHYLGMKFENARKHIESIGKKPRNVLGDPDVMNSSSEIQGQGSGKPDFAEKQKLALQNFKFEVETEPPPEEEKKEIMFLIRIIVSWQLEEGVEESRQYLVLEGIKYQEGQI